MQYELLTFDQLTPTDIDTWICTQEADADFCSPFFRPEFVEDIAAVRENIRVAVGRSDAGTCILPIHIDRGAARAPAAHMSDFEGAVMTPGVDLDPRKLLRGCQLNSWRVHHLVTSQRGCEDAMWVRIPSLYINLTDGFDAYVAERRQSRGRLIKEIERKLRKVERDFSEVTFTLDDQEPDALRWLIDEKSRQMNERNQWNFLQVPWAVPLYERTLAHRTPDYRGLVSTFRYDGRIVAAHLGIQSHQTLHSWTHVFDPAEKKTSPGTAMQYLLAKHASEAGMTRIDMGRGNEDYKPRFANDETEIAEGAVEQSMFASVARKTWYSAREAVRETSLGKPAQNLIRQVRLWKRSLASSATS